MMGEALREPPVPADCDLRGLPWMPIDTVRLLDSDLFALADGEQFKAAVRLWCKAWHQVPASSLPDDDRILASLSGMGRLWLKVRPMALRGFFKCADGRLYHPVIAEKALEAWDRRIAQRARAVKRWHPSGNAAAYPAAMLGTGQGQDNKKRERPARGARLPSDWQPSEELKAWAARKRPDLDPAEVLATFRDYWTAAPGAKGVKLDWSATFRVWVRNEKPGRPGAAPPRLRVCAYCPKPSAGSVNGLEHCDAHVLDAMDSKPRIRAAA